MAPSEPTSSSGAGTNGRTLFKGRLKPPPRRSPYSEVTVQTVLPQSKITAESLRKPRPEVVFVNSTEIRLPFLEPDAPGGQQNRGGRSA